MILKGYANIPAGQIHYRRQHGPGFPVVCLHQTASSSAMFVRLMEKLAGQRAFIAFDTPGFGASFDPPQMPGSIRAYAEWIREALDALGVGQFHLLGHHTGACIGAELAVHHAERVVTTSFIGPVPLTEGERNEFRKHYSTPFAPDPDGQYLLTTWKYLQGLGAGGELGVLHRELLDTARAWQGRFWAYSNVWNQDWIALYKAIRCPLQILCAPDDVLAGFFQRARELRPDADAVEVKGACFEPDLDPAGVASAYQAFLVRHGH
jgi:pimeloyl-ACP methyl ester carboxylesterase